MTGGVLAFAPAHNSHGLHDATGAFQPMARAFCDMHGGRVHLFDNHAPMPDRGAEILDELERYDGPTLVAVAFLCHGWSRGIQAGFDLRPGKRRGLPVAALSGALAARSGTGLIVPLFCCSTGGTPERGAPGGDGGFADELRDALYRDGVTNSRVDAHDRKGHSTRNPYVRRFEGAEGKGGRWLIAPKSEHWRAWARALRDQDSDFSVEYPFLDRRTIVERLS